MPANMISEPAGSSLKVIGSSSATVSAGPMPGSTPTAVPSMHADQREQQVHRLQRDGEALGQCGERVHQSSRSSGPAGSDRLSSLVNIR